MPSRSRPYFPLPLLLVILRITAASPTAPYIPSPQTPSHHSAFGYALRIPQPAHTAPRELRIRLTRSAFTAEDTPLHTEPALYLVCTSRENGCTIRLPAISARLEGFCRRGQWTKAVDTIHVAVGPTGDYTPVFSTSLHCPGATGRQAPFTLRPEGIDDVEPPTDPEGEEPTFDPLPTDSSESRCPSANSADQSPFISCLSLPEFSQLYPSLFQGVLRFPSFFPSLASFFTESESPAPESPEGEPPSAETADNDVARVPSAPLLFGGSL